MRHINLMQPYIPEAAKAAVADVLSTRWIGQGPKVEEFERRFSQFVGRPSIATGSCTDALHLAYILAGIKEGDEVIAPVFTCTATNIPLLYQRAKIRFYDVAPGSLNGDPVAIARMVNERTKAIVVVHYGGQRVKTGGLIGPYSVIEDCAQSLGGPPPLGDFACYSFQAVKHITTGDGGMLSMLEDLLVAKAKRIRWFGIDREAKLAGKWANDIYEVGYKYQMTDIAAAMGIAGLDSLKQQINRRRFLRGLYQDELFGIDGIRLIDTDPDSACWLCTVAVERREDFRRMLASHGVESDQTHYRNDRYTIFREFRGEFPNMDAIEDKYLVIPMHMGMEIEDVQRICSLVRAGW